MKDVATLITFKSIDPGNATTSLATALEQRMPDFGGAELSLFFANCETDTQVSPGDWRAWLLTGSHPAADLSALTAVCIMQVSFDVTAKLYNVKGERKDYLGVGEDALPTVYMVTLAASIICGCMLLCLTCTVPNLHWF